MMVKQSLLFLSLLFCASAQRSEKSLRAGREFQQLDGALDNKQEITESSQYEESMNEDVGRRLVGWLTFVMEVGPLSCEHQPNADGHCGPLHHHCCAISNSVGGGGGGSSSGSANDSSSGSSSGGSANDSSSGGSSSAASASDSSSGAATGGDSANPLASASAKTFSGAMMLVAAVAVAAAVGAAVVGSRKREVKPHPLSGSVMRRLHLFSNFADRSLCDASQNNRTPRVVEMVDNGDGSPYRLA